MTLNKVRQRKTKDPCPRCHLHKDFCICSQISRLNTATRVCLLIHAKEIKRTTNTGRLALEALSNSEMRVRGVIGESGDLSDLLVPEYRTWLLYPSDEATELSAELVSSDSRPVQLLVPDGNWRQASKVHYRHKELASVLRVKCSGAIERPHYLRKEHVQDGMATLEAIAQALYLIEGKAVGDSLMKLYHLKLEKTLLARGIKL